MHDFPLGAGPQSRRWSDCEHGSGVPAGSIGIICRDGGATPMTLEADDWAYSAAI
jgi:hypothetical protein